MSRLLLLSLFLLVTTGVYCQTASLPRSTPEAEGVSSKNIINFLNALDTGKHEFHSIMILRHGKVIAEGWWNPYLADLKHTLYSTSKSFTSTAIGFAVQDKLLTVTDKVISFFPDKLPDTVNQNLKDLTVQDLLTMEVGHDTDPTFEISSKQTDWVKSFLAYPIPHKPGTHFVYNSLSTYMLSAIVQKVTGTTTIEYLTKKLFDPLGIEGMDWESDPAGINVGGWGLRLKTEDIAKLGQLYLQKGKWNGTALLPESWINDASTNRTEQGPTWTNGLSKDSSDWMQGYGYQFWRCRNNAYRADGAYGQYIIIMPDQDAVIAITSETMDMQGQINLVWKHLLPAMKSGSLAADRRSQTVLKSKLASLRVHTPKQAKIRGTVPSKTYTVENNPMNIESFSFTPKGNELQVTIETDSSSHDYLFANGSWKAGETQQVGPSLIGAAKTDLATKTPFLVAGNYIWLDDKTIECVLQYTQSAHSQHWRFTVDGDNFEAKLVNSAGPDNVITFKGTAE